MRATAQLLQHGVAGAIGAGTYTADLDGSASTSTFAKAVIAAMCNADISGLTNEPRRGCVMT